MPLYLVNREMRDGRYHEVHTSVCSHRPETHNSYHLGNHNDCASALRAAEAAGFRPADGCFYCSRTCHKG